MSARVSERGLLGGHDNLLQPGSCRMIRQRKGDRVVVEDGEGFHLEPSLLEGCLHLVKEKWTEICVYIVWWFLFQVYGIQVSLFSTMDFQVQCIIK